MHPIGVTILVIISFVSLALMYEPDKLGPIGR